MTENYKSSDRLRDVIANDYRLLQVMSRFGISMGFGDKSILEVCQQCGVDSDTFLAIINYVRQGAENKPQKVDNVNVGSILRFLKKSHSYFLDFIFPSIRFHLLNAIDCSMKNEIAYLILRFYDEYVEEVRTHMESEENGTFILVQQLIDGENIPLEKSQLLSKHHEDIEKKLKELKNMFIKYYPQAEINERLNAVIISIYQAEEELAIHCLVEDNIFAPAIRKLKRRNEMMSVQKSQQAQVDTDKPQEETLSEREKEIVMCVARGMQNKDIADKLFLSINTVTTHRRNIARKLQIHSSAGITIYAIVNKLVTLEEIRM
ncbi:MAG: LuxR C-terminal-related transcriptional regulator [Bacteroidaceae bacterium]|nr:LuxR C-terminal-related transcriptional regulator [Bacteroidaceae bacterium]